MSDRTGRLPAPAAPASLNKAEAVIWQHTVDRARAGDILALYVAHVAEAERLRLAARDPELSLAEFGNILGLQQREFGLALSYARALRLTTQSRIGARTAGARADRQRPGIAALWARDPPDQSE